MNNALMFSSATDEWETPQELFDELDAEFAFTWDVAASASNHKCTMWLGPESLFTDGKDALALDWSQLPPFGYSRPVVWCNPPYSRGLQKRFIAKAAIERLRGVTTVMLLPARTDTKAFHEHIYDASKWQARKGVEIRLLKGRLKFGGATTSAPFPSMIIVFRP